MEILDQVVAWLSSVNPVMLGSIAVVLEFVFRLVPTSKPLSIAQLIAKVARSVGVIFTKIADVLDKVLPQHVKPEVK